MMTNYAKGLGQLARFHGVDGKGLGGDAAGGHRLVVGSDHGGGEWCHVAVTDRICRDENGRSVLVKIYVLGSPKSISDDGIEVAPGDEITLETVDELKPALLKSADDPAFLYLLMPVRLPG